MSVRVVVLRIFCLLLTALLCSGTLLVTGIKNSYASGKNCSTSSNTIYCHVKTGGTDSSTGSNNNPGSGGSYTVVSSKPVCVWTYLGVGVDTSNSSFGSTQGTYYKISCSLNAVAPNLSYYNVVYFSRGYFIIWIPPSKPTNFTSVDYKNVASQAANSITLPSPYIEMNPSAMGIVNLPEIFAINSSIWHPYTAAASVGGVSASATATPIGINWNFGDGSTLSCLSTTQLLIPNLDTCTHGYRLSSYLAQKLLNISNLGYEITATVVWSVTWSSSTPGFSGNLGTLYTTGTTYLQVEQIESINN